MSSRILKPTPDSLGIKGSTESWRTMKKPLIGSLNVVRVKSLATTVAKRLAWRRRWSQPATSVDVR